MTFLETGSRKAAEAAVAEKMREMTKAQIGIRPSLSLQRKLSRL